MPEFFMSLIQRQADKHMTTFQQTQLIAHDPGSQAMQSCMLTLHSISVFLFLKMAAAFARQSQMPYSRSSHWHENHDPLAILHLKLTGIQKAGCAMRIEAWHMNVKTLSSVWPAAGTYW